MLTTEYECTEVSYSNEEVKTYFTVSSSGTLALDRDVNVKMKINEELVDIYNKNTDRSE